MSDCWAGESRESWEEMLACTSWCCVNRGRERVIDNGNACMYSVCTIRHCPHTGKINKYMRKKLGWQEGAVKGTSCQVTAWVQSWGQAEWKEKDDTWKLSSDLYIHSMTLPHTNKYLKTFNNMGSNMFYGWMMRACDSLECFRGEKRQL